MEENNPQLAVIVFTENYLENTSLKIFIFRFISLFQMKNIWIKVYQYTCTYNTHISTVLDWIENVLMYCTIYSQLHNLYINLYKNMI